MAHSDRANVASSFTIIKGSMIEESYAVFAAWDYSRSKRENLDRLRQDNFIGASSATWLRDVAKVFNRRFDPEGRDRALAVLAKGGCELDVWKPILLWHITRDEFLLRDFLVNHLFPAFEGGTFRLRPDDLESFLTSIHLRGGISEHEWSVPTRKRVAAGLLRIAVDFGLLRGAVTKEFASFHLSELAFLYIVHAIAEEGGSSSRVLHSHDWRLFLMRPAHVESELLRLHQFRKVGYEVAGSLVQLSLPCGTALEFAERMVA